MDNGQLDRKDPALKYPCSLVKFESNNKDIDESGSQEKSYTLTLRTAFDATGSRTAGDTPEAALNRSLAYADVVSDVYDAFQAVALGDYTEFECVSEGLEPRSDGLVVFKQTFKTSRMVFK
jgi:hypothetical protein